MSSVKRFRIEIDDTDVARVMMQAQFRAGASTPVGYAPGTTEQVGEFVYTPFFPYRGSSIRSISPTDEKNRIFADEIIAPNKIFGLSAAEEMSDYMKFGYMDRTTRALISRIPGMSPILYDAYRGRNIMTGLRRSLLNLDKTIGMGEDPNLPWDKALQSTWLGAGAIGAIQGTAAILLLLITLWQIIEPMIDEQRKLKEELASAVRGSTGMSYKQYEMWRKTQTEKFSSSLVL